MILFVVVFVSVFVLVFVFFFPTNPKSNEMAKAQKRNRNKIERDIGNSTVPTIHHQQIKSPPINQISTNKDTVRVGGDE